MRLIKRRGGQRLLLKARGGDRIGDGVGEKRDSQSGYLRAMASLFEPSDGDFTRAIPTIGLPSATSIE
jgi:hypothetical protein